MSSTLFQEDTEEIKFQFDLIYVFQWDTVFQNKIKFFDFVK